MNGYKNFNVELSSYKKNLNLEKIKQVLLLFLGKLKDKFLTERNLTLALKNLCQLAKNARSTNIYKIFQLMVDLGGKLDCKFPDAQGKSLIFLHVEACAEEAAEVPHLYNELHDFEFTKFLLAQKNITGPQEMVQVNGVEQNVFDLVAESNIKRATNLSMHYRFFMENDVYRPEMQAAYVRAQKRHRELKARKAHELAQSVHMTAVEYSAFESAMKLLPIYFPGKEEASQRTARMGAMILELEKKLYEYLVNDIKQQIIARHKLPEDYNFGENPAFSFLFEGLKDPNNFENAVYFPWLDLPSFRAWRCIKVSFPQRKNVKMTLPNSPEFAGKSLTNLEMLAVTIAGMTDHTVYNDPAKQQNVWNTFISELASAQTNYARGAGSDGPICGKGMFAKLISSLDGTHPEVYICYLGGETLKSTICDYFDSQFMRMDRKEKMEIAVKDKEKMVMDVTEDGKEKKETKENDHKEKEAFLATVMKNEGSLPAEFIKSVTAGFFELKDVQYVLSRKIMKKEEFDEWLQFGYPINHCTEMTRFFLHKKLGAYLEELFAKGDERIKKELSGILPGKKIIPIAILAKFKDAFLELPEIADLVGNGIFTIDEDIGRICFRNDLSFDHVRNIAKFLESTTPAVLPLYAGYIGKTGGKGSDSSRSMAMVI